jgi:peptidoglycan/LPS O-acetylase OafA/YrhL
MLAVGVWIERLILTHFGASPGRLYLGTDARADGLLLGAAAALANYGGLHAALQSQQRLTNWLAAGSLTLFALTVIFWAGALDSLGYCGQATVMSVLCVVLVASSAAATGGVAHRLLTSPLLRWLGGISYALYLWHMPLMQVLLMRTSQWQVALLVGGGVSIVLAVLSTRFVERPLMKFKHQFDRPSRLGGRAGHELSTADRPVIAPLTEVGLG